MRTQNLLSVFAEKELKRFKLKVGIFFILINEERILLMRRFQTGIDDGNYVVPMGRSRRQGNFNFSLN